MKASEFVTEAQAVKQRLDPKCRKGKHKEGTKIKGGVRVNNCVPNESVAEGSVKDINDIVGKYCAQQGITRNDLTNYDVKQLSKLSGLPTYYIRDQLIKTSPGITENTELVKEFDLIESIIESIADHNGVDAELVWEDLESLTEDELYAFAVTSQLNEDWQKVNKKDKTDGMSKKAVSAYRREHPGSKLKTAVTTKPSKLKKGSKASKRRKSYCSRSKGQMKMHNISCAKTPDKAICKARRRWNC